MELAACRTALATLLLALALAAPVSAEVGHGGQTQIATRYGNVDVVDTSDAVAIRVRGKVVRSIDALGASLHRVTPRDQREFVLVDASTPGLHCHHFFVLLELSDSGKPVVSKPFGECKELQGVVFHGDVPFIRLCDPYIAGRKTPSGATDVEWRNGAIMPVRQSLKRHKSPPGIPACSTASSRE